MTQSLEAISSPAEAGAAPFSPFDNIPNELLTRIITIASDDTSHPDTEISKYGKRVMYPFGRVASLVCRRWFDVTRSSANGHLWKTRVIVRLRDSFRRHYATQALVDLKIALAGSFGSDLEVEFHCSLFRPSAVSGEAHCFHVALYLLKDYTNQISSLCFFYGEDTALPALFDAAQIFRMAQRLHRLAFQPTGPSFVPMPDSFVVPSLVDLYDLTGCRGFPLSLTSFRASTSQWNEKLLRKIPLSDSLTSLELRGAIRSTGDFDSNFLIRAVAAAHSLTNLVYEIPHMMEVKVTPIQTRLTKLRNISIRERPSLLDAFFGSFEFPRLEVLNLSVWEGDHISSFRSAKGLIYLPSLHSITYSASEWSSHFVARLTSLDALVNLRIREPLTPTHTMHTPSERFLSVVNVTIQFLEYPLATRSQTLSSVDLSRTQTLTCFEFTYRPYNSTKNDATVKSVARLHAPVLTKLEIIASAYHGFLFGMLQSILGMLLAPMLNEIAFTENSLDAKMWLRLELSLPGDGDTLTTPIASASMIPRFARFNHRGVPMTRIIWFVEVGMRVDNFTLVVDDGPQDAGFTSAIRMLDFLHMGLKTGWYGDALQHQSPKLLLSLKTLQVALEIQLSHEQKKRICSVMASIADARAAMGVPFESVGVVDRDGSNLPISSCNDC
jgi:hypothetical protein